jgi:hypothetical protein
LDKNRLGACFIQNCLVIEYILAFNKAFMEVKPKTTIGNQVSKSFDSGEK